MEEMGSSWVYVLERENKTGSVFIHFFFFLFCNWIKILHDNERSRSIRNGGGPEKYNIERKRNPKRRLAVKTHIPGNESCMRVKLWILINNKMGPVPTDSISYVINGGTVGVLEQKNTGFDVLVHFKNENKFMYSFFNSIYTEINLQNKCGLFLSLI